MSSDKVCVQVKCVLWWRWVLHVELVPTWRVELVPTWRVELVPTWRVELVRRWQFGSTGLLKILDDVQSAERWGEVHLPHRPLWTLGVVGHLVTPGQ